MIYFSSLLKTLPNIQNNTNNLLSLLSKQREQFEFIKHTKDIWVRDFMPVRTSSGRYVSFQYDPRYLKGYEDYRTDYQNEISEQFSFSVTYSSVNLDGGNVVFSPSRKRAIISDRVFLENPYRCREDLLFELQNVLEAEIVIIDSLKSDLTGHADGMVRFIDEHRVLGNDIPSKNGLEQRIKRALKKHEIKVIDFPYFFSSNGSAVGCYLNYLETEQYIFLPVFGVKTDKEAFEKAQNIFWKKVIPVKSDEIAKEGGVLNCVSWES